MPALMTIELKELWFYAFHGLYPEEKKTGNEFEINLSADYLPGETVLTEIDTTIDYTRVYQIVKSEMNKPRPLLETLAMEIAEAIHDMFPQITKVDITITKLHPPIAQFAGNVGVRYQKKF